MTEQTKQASGMELSRKLFQEIHATGYTIRTEGAKSLRGEFIARAVAECGLTKNGASTYFQNLKNEAAGKPLYHKKESEQKSTFVDVSDAFKQANQNGGSDSNTVNAEVNSAKRWMVVDENGQEVGAYDTRKQAQEAKAEGQKVKDREKVEA